MIKWTKGRQDTGYFKITLISFWFFDLHILKFPVGSYIPKHKDPVIDKSHYRLNYIFNTTFCGGFFKVGNRKIKDGLVYFKPDIEEHEVTKIKCGTRYVLSLGWVL